MCIDGTDVTIIHVTILVATLHRGRRHQRYTRTGEQGDDDP